MEKFTAKTFTIPELRGISSKNIEEHLKLYKGYVTNSNLILNKIKEYSEDYDKNSYAISELQRRFSFEFDGMRNHEYYFSSLSEKSNPIKKESELYVKIEEQFGSYENFILRFKNLAMTRGAGWAMLYHDAQSNSLLIQWVEEQHLGHLIGLSPVLALDMWEHAYVYDYPTSEKKNYVEAFFENLNWEVIEENFKNAQ
jgi:Fe-Mn family superoxide dismutase